MPSNYSLASQARGLPKHVLAPRGILEVEGRCGFRILHVAVQGPAASGRAPAEQQYLILVEALQEREHAPLCQAGFTAGLA